MSVHQTASFVNSCVIAPRHPKTKLPTTALERKSLENMTNDKGILAQHIHSNINHKPHASGEKKKRKTAPRPNSSENVIRRYKAPSNMSMNHSHAKVDQSQCMNNISYHNDMSLAEDDENGQSMFSQNSKSLEKLINDDQQFFQHLQHLKSENQKTLKKLEKLYFKSLSQKRNSFVENSADKGDYTADSLNTNEHFTHSRIRNSFDWKDRREEDSEQYYDESSEDELDEQLKVKEPEDFVNILPEEENDFRGRESSYDVIANMWENFSVDEYVPYSRRNNMKAKEAWSPTVTIPEPFQMTVREEKKSKKKSKKILQIEDELLQKKLQDEAELHKRIVPTPVPPSTFLPLYDEIKEHKEQKRHYVRELSKEILKSSEKPFSFIKREQAKNQLKRSQSLNSLHKRCKVEKQKNLFKANPFPDKLFDLTLADKQAEQEEYRKIKIKLRSQEMLAGSSLPPNMKTRNKKFYPAGEKTKRVKEELRKRREKSFKPQVNHDIPDFEQLQRKNEVELEQRKTMNTPTICEPFSLHTAKIPKRRSEFRKSVEVKKASERPPSSRGSSMSYHGSSNSLLDRSPRVGRQEETPTYGLTETTRLRQERMRQSLEQSKQEVLRKSVDDYNKMKKQAGLRQKVTKKALAQDPAKNRVKESEEKLQSFREADQARRNEYRYYLREMENRLDHRPLLFERESQTNAKRKARRRYEEILQQAGVEGNILQSVLNASTEDFSRLENDRNDTSDVEKSEEVCMGSDADSDNDERYAADEKDNYSNESSGQEVDSTENSDDTFDAEERDEIEGKDDNEQCGYESDDNDDDVSNDGSYIPSPGTGQHLVNDVLSDDEI